MQSSKSFLTFRFAFSSLSSLSRSADLSLFAADEEARALVPACTGDIDDWPSMDEGIVSEQLELSLRAIYV